MILKGVYGYRVRWREHRVLRQRTCPNYEAARRLDAQKVLKKRGGQGRGRPETPLNVSVKDYAAQWLDRERVRVAPKTHASFAETVKRYIVKEGVGIGTLRVRDVERADIETLLQQASTKSRSGVLSKNTLRIIRATCSLLFEAAMMERPVSLIDANPCRGVKLGTLSQADRQRTIRSMTYEQVVRFLRTAKRHCSRRDYTLFHTLADTGLRPSEALALQWPDIDTSARTVRVERAVTIGRQIKPTKTGSARTVPLTVPLAEALAKWHRNVVRKPGRSEFVFPSRQTGGPLNVKRVGRHFRGLLRRAGLGPFKLYDLRHTLASHLLDQGVKITDVADVMGHSKPTTTLQFYAHSIPGDKGYIDRLTAARHAKW
jgi:integrase